MKLVLGTVQFGLDYGINNSKGKPHQDEVFKVLNRAYELGIDELDTADAYGNSVEVLAAYRSNYPNTKFKIMSKFICEKNCEITAAFEISCKRLEIEKLDGYYFHRFEDFKSFNNFDGVNQLKSQGKLGKLCVSLYSLEDLELAVNSPHVDLIQLPFNVFDRSREKIALLKKAKEQGKQIYVRSAFLQGLFFKDPDQLPPKLVPLRESLIKLKSLSTSYQISIEEICLKFLDEQSFIDKIVIGVDSSAQLESNIHSLNKKLPQELLTEIINIPVLHPELLNPVNWNN